MSVLNQNLDVSKIQCQWFGEDKDHKNPGVVVVDDILSDAALKRIRQLLLESTVWYQTKTPLRFGGYVGAYIDDTAITTAVKARFIDNKTVDASAISVETLKGTVMLSGFAKSDSEKRVAESVAWKVEGVKSVKNEITVRP